MNKVKSWKKLLINGFIIIILLIGLSGCTIDDQYILEIKIEGNGTTDPPQGNHSYDPGEEETIKAIPDSNWSFSKWSGNIS